MLEYTKSKITWCIGLEVQPNMIETKQIGSIIIKVNSQCNLKCNYCYYLLPKRQLHEKQGEVMSEELLLDIADQATKFDEQSVSIIFHGGEPLLSNIDTMKRVFKQIRGVNSWSGRISLQTNGTLLNQDWINTFIENKVSVGISIDGPKDIHDAYRLYKNNHSSFNHVIRAIELLKASDVPCAVLAVVNKYSCKQPEKTYKFFSDNPLGDVVHNLDFLPCRPVDIENGKYDMRHALSNDELYKFYSKVFDLWIEDDNPSMQIRYFKNTIKSLIGGKPTLCDFIDGCGTFVSIEPSGEVYPCDNLTPFQELSIGDVGRDSIKSILRSKAYKEFLELVSRSEISCQQCFWADNCYGGCFEDRYVASKKLDQPGYYCESRRKLFDHIMIKLKNIIDNPN